jgi:glutathione-independent formaldehyde dehydrogenase
MPAPRPNRRKGGIDDDAKISLLRVRFGLGWAASHRFTIVRCPVTSYNRRLTISIRHDRAQIAERSRSIHTT